MTTMFDEIHQQPTALRATLEYLDHQVGEIEDVSDQKIQHVLLIGRGTSDNVCNYAQYIFPVVAGRLATSFSPSVATSLKSDVPLENTLVIAVSQSGSTTEIVDSVLWARSNGARTIGVTNVEGSALTDAVDLALVTPAGVEHAVPATKSYTSALLTMAMVAGVVGRNMEFRNMLRTVPSVVEAQLASAQRPEEFLDVLLNADTAIVAGRGFSFGVAAEIALKLTETSSINARGTSTADLMHGPVAALIKDLPLILLSTGEQSAFASGVNSIHQRAISAGCRVLMIGPKRAAVTPTRYLPTENLPEVISPFALSVAGQLLAEAHATSLGLDPDNPLGLKKVTETL